MKKWIIKLVSLLLVIILAPTIFVVSVENIPNQYDKTYLAEMLDKYEMLKSKKNKKVIFVGGSALPFGLRSDLLEKTTENYEFVNFGLYATIGTKYMMDVSKCNIAKGDVVVLTPELNAQTYSLYFNPDAVLEACDGWSSMYGNLSISDRMQLMYNYPGFAKRKIGYKSGNNKPDPIGIYRHDSFNAYGEISVERKQNTMPNGYDSTTLIEFKNELFNQEFIDYVNDYNKYIEKKGAKLYFAFTPLNEKALTASSKKRVEFQNQLSKLLNCDLLFGVEDGVMDYRYFYDTNFHLNTAGAIAYTSKVKDFLTSKIEDLNSVGTIDVPNPPKIEEGEIDPPIPVDPVPFDKYKGEPNNDYVNCFEYQRVENTYKVVGIKNEYKNMEEVIMPSTYNKLPITTIATDGLYGATNLKRIHIGQTYRALEKGCFNSCISLERIYLYQMDGNQIVPSPEELLTGCSRFVKIYIPEGSNYEYGYTWIYYRDKFVFFGDK